MKLRDLILLFTLLSSGSLLAQKPIQKDSVIMNFRINGEVITVPLYRITGLRQSGIWDDAPYHEYTIDSHKFSLTLEQAMSLDSIYVEGFDILNFGLSYIGLGIHGSCTGYTPDSTYTHSTLCDYCFEILATNRKYKMDLGQLILRDRLTGDLLKHPTYNIYTKPPEQAKRDPKYISAAHWLDNNQQELATHQVTSTITERPNNCFFIDLTSPKKKGRLTYYGDGKYVYIRITSVATNEDLFIENCTMHAGIDECLSTFFEEIKN